MWINVEDKSVPTRGTNEKSVLLLLKYNRYYGHSIPRETEIVLAMYDSLNECFYEINTDMEIDNRDIVQWWSDDIE